LIINKILYLINIIKIIENGIFLNHKIKNFCQFYNFFLQKKIDKNLRFLGLHLKKQVSIIIFAAEFSTVAFSTL